MTDRQDHPPPGMYTTRFIGESETHWHCMIIAGEYAGFKFWIPKQSFERKRATHSPPSGVQ